jgi:hypothetical protein
LNKKAPEDNEIEAVVENIIYLGDCYEITMAGCGTQFSLETDSSVRLAKNQKVIVGMNDKAMKLWPA